MMTRNENVWWDWHDGDAANWSPGEDPDAAVADAEARCAAWVRGDNDDGPWNWRDDPEEVAAARADHEYDVAKDDALTGDR